MLNHLKKFERWINAVLIALMSLVILLAVGELAWILLQDMMTPPYLVLEIHELQELFGLFLLVLIGIELLETIKDYFKYGKIDLKIVFTVALIAISRKIIILEPEKYDPMTLFGICGIILALVAGYWVTVTLNRRYVGRSPSLPRAPARRVGQSTWPE